MICQLNSKRNPDISSNFMAVKLASLIIRTHYLKLLNLKNINSLKEKDVCRLLHLTSVDVKTAERYKYFFGSSMKKGQMSGKADNVCSGCADC